MGQLKLRENAMRRGSKRRVQAGFTLIELIVAGALLVIGVMALSTMVALAVKNNGHSRLDSSATMLNQAVVEQVMSGISFQSYCSPSDTSPACTTGQASLYDCGTHTVANANPWPIHSALGGAGLISGKIDFSQPQVGGYSMNYVTCLGSNRITYDVRWNISALTSTDNTSFTHILTVGSRMLGGPGIINFPINMRVMLGPDPPKGS